MPLAVAPGSCPQLAQAGRTAWAGRWVLGVVQVFTGLVLLGLGSTLFFASGDRELCIAYWYPLWGAALYVVAGYYISSTATNPSRRLVSYSAVSSCLGFLASLVGAVLLALDLLRVSFRHPLRGVFAVSPLCERSSVPAEHCRRLLIYELGLLVLMMIFTIFEVVISSIAFSYSLKDRSLDHQLMEQAFPLPELRPPQAAAGTSPSQLPSGLPPPYSRGNFPLEPQGV
ncbi:B-lymphocyte antigen CD20-like isoform X2 [Apteryx rowi]|uniref:B-lymphocyte antigen CD20-like isoform X2 n=1 Tax=Apteryx rowi TaxID=308060 RepID=UPI000E1D181F|nr:B-lymphocyte antigen CD20-like isoform X2 [Apteryx rowi]